MMGEGFGINPTEGTVVSPIEGNVDNVFPTKHAIGLKAENGLELLVHIGLDTVQLDGEGFEVLVDSGDTVKVGDQSSNLMLNILETMQNQLFLQLLLQTLIKQHLFTLKMLTQLLKVKQKLLM